MSKEFEVYKGEHRSAYIVFKDLSIPKKEMIKIANNGYFKVKLENLECVSGYIDEDNLYFSSRYVEGKQVVWIVKKVNT